jgi:predicted membrane-bound spermidine synthase
MPFLFDSARQEKSPLFLSLLFFSSGMPAMVYQIVWQRALFAIYGVNAESVAVVVTAFMIGLGVGSLVGGRLSTRFPRHGILMFGIAELGVALFGLASLHIFHWAAARTAGTNLVLTVVFSLLLLLIPTVLMGATLPLLVEHLVLRTNHVGTSVATLYFANTFGSAVACYLCATVVLRNFGQSGSVTIAACTNTAVGATAYLYSRSGNRNFEPQASAKPPARSGSAAMPLYRAMLLAGLSGFIALGFEILWFHVFSVASSDRAEAFALLLCTYLAGIAAGSVLSEKLTAGWRPESLVRFIGGLLVLSGALSAYLPPLVASLMARKIAFLVSAPAFFVTAGLIGSVLPLLCQLAVAPERQAGQAVSLVYVSNIAGSALGSLGVGFVLLEYFGLKQISVAMGLSAVVAGSILLIFYFGRASTAPRWAIALTVAALAAVPVSLPLYRLLYEKLVFGSRAEASVPFVHIVENRNGMIGVTRDGAVFGGGVYDGYFNIDPTNDVNLVVRVYLLSALCPSPKRVLVIGLASGSWAQILANHPQVETLDAVEINPGYLQLIPQYPMVQSFVHNPRVRIYIDDARRWLNAHPDARYDAIVANTTFNWRDHSSGLLSVEFLRLIRSHLNRGGVYYFNSTESEETIATALSVFPYGLRVINFVAASDSPITVDKERLAENLHRYRIDGELLFDAQSNPAAEKALAAYVGLVDTLQAPPRFLGMESSDSLRARLRRRLIITDDNMGLEWGSEPLIPWH